MSENNDEKAAIVSYSGGLGSYLTAYRLKQRGLSNVKLVFCDTKTEDEDLYRFLDESSEQLGFELITLADGRDVWQVFNDVKFMGNNRIDPCSMHLKRDLFKKWIKDNYSPEACIIYVGIGWDEIHRLKTIKERWEPFQIEAPLTEKPYLVKQDASKFLGDIEIPRLYKYGFQHNNCGGFCVKSGQSQFSKLLRHFPERYKHHEEEQEKLFNQIGQHGFIRVTTDGELKYLSLKEFRLMLESKEDQLELDLSCDGGCGCFV